ncbi:beta-1,3-galactosyltransferase 5-like [Littorina saxatilis]|uniref:Hexosyltransferase n=1 Tax=Littorina saxatilis TaxID=31220 RepID=A0AAN9BBD0_9CAEN
MFPRLPRILRFGLVALSLSLSLLLLLRAGGPAPPRMEPPGEAEGKGGFRGYPRRLPSPAFQGPMSPSADRSRHRFLTTSRHKVTVTRPLGLTTAGRSVLQEKDIVNPHPFKYLLNPGEAVCRTSVKSQGWSRSQGQGQHTSSVGPGHTNSTLGQTQSRHDTKLGQSHSGQGQGYSQSHVWLLVYVHSAPANLKKRQSIRETWGSRSSLREHNASLVFILGSVPDPKLLQLLLMENERYGDIVQEDFLDSYRNLTYKAIAGLKWAATFCSKATYILKTDDDILVNLPQVVKHLQTVVTPQYGHDRLILCNQWQRMKIIRDKKSKWYIPEGDFPGDYFPPYCSGSAFVLSGDMAQLMYEASLVTRFFWVDDYYITGALIKHLDVKHRKLNQAYSLNPSVAEGKFRNDTKHELFFFHLHKLRVLYGLWQNMTSPGTPRTRSPLLRGIPARAGSVTPDNSVLRSVPPVA